MGTRRLHHPVRSSVRVLEAVGSHRKYPHSVVPRHYDDLGSAPDRPTSPGPGDGQLAFDATLLIMPRALSAPSALLTRNIVGSAAAFLLTTKAVSVTIPLAIRTD